MTRWEELTMHERTALRHLFQGEVFEVPGHIIRRLRALGLIDSDSDDRLSPAGLELYLTNGRRTGRRK
jgi:hypothetical protein